MTRTAAQQIGELAANALDMLEDGGGLIGAVLLIVDRHPEDRDLLRTMWSTPEEQVWPMTLGIVEQWRQEQLAGLTISGFDQDTDDDEDGGL